METPAIKSDFIPQAGKSVVTRKFGYPNAFFVFSWVVFLGAMLLWGGLLVYEYFIEQNKVTLLSQLQTVIQKEDIDTGVIDELSRLDKQLKLADAILRKHSNLSLLFSFLEKVTLTNSLRFQSFGMQPEEGTDRVEVLLTGRARSFASLGYQIETFKEDHKDDISEVTFSGLSIDEETGDITFSLSFFINPLLVSHQKSAGVETSE